jgi:hypothetical protein
MKLYRNARIVMLLVLGVVCLNACQKLEQPPLGDYPVDANPPGGPLKFYAAMDEKNVDSVKANYGTFNNASIADGGVSGKCAQFDGSMNGFINYPSANDFGQSTSFTISFWINITMAQKDDNHAVGVLAFANSVNFWGNITFYADNNTKSPSDSMDLKIHFGDVNNGDNWNFAGYNFAHAWPKMYDGNWHQVAFTYDATTKTGTVYRDGAQFDQQTNQSIAFENSSQLILGGFEQAAGITDSYSNNTWMAGFPGKMDNVRLYGEALSASDIKSIYDNKE